mmetsp:Transcript_18290/g.38041  ORF Transcript_18290/g.38041 Transcript_18290/m.38041 type:complete len:635 (+) Transcript_18290:132-2036(+)
MRDSEKDLDKSKGEMTQMGKKLEEQQFEIDEMAAMQVELLEQLKISSSEVESKTRTISEQQAEIESRDKEIETLSQNLDNTTNSLSATLSELTVSKDKLSSVIPKLDSADAELRLLRARMRELENVEIENSKLAVEMGVLTPMRSALDGVAEELRTSSTFVPGTTKTQFHQGWASSPHLTSLLPSLGDRIQSLLNDLSVCESQSKSLEKVLSDERSERTSERGVLSDSLLSKENECRQVTERLKAVTDEDEELRMQVEKARAASMAISHLRTVWLSHCQDENDAGGGSDMDVVHNIGRALYAGRQAQAAQTANLEKLVEAEAMLNMKELELTRLSTENKEVLRQMSSMKASTDNDINALRSEGIGLASELESAAELAERQGALAVTLEGRLEALSAERAMLSAQFHASQTEIEQYRSELSAALSKAVALAQDNITLSSTVDPSSSTSTVVACVCECLDKLSTSLPEVSEQLVEAKARLEMSEVTKLARNGAYSATPVPVPAPTPSSAVSSALNNSVSSEVGGSLPASASASETLSRHKRDLALMQKKYLGGQFARSAVDASATRSLRSQQPMSTPVMPRSGSDFAPSATASTSTATKLPSTDNNTKKPRAPSPGTALLQERLRKAQAQFSLLTK